MMPVSRTGWSCAGRSRKPPRYVDRVLYRTTTRSALSMTSSTTVRWSANVLGYQRSQATNPARSVVPPGP